ncbi:MAG: hypothetical protein ACTH5B_21195 [Marinomonas sp.]|uniref:hypothetical protein n=1 Tax=Marinomonas sp. TaxID=1904862 RepID=UPI003F95950A
MMQIMMSQVAGITKSLEMLGVRIVAIRANAEGAQIKIDQPLPAELYQYVDGQSEAGHNLWGVWITWPTD